MGPKLGFLGGIVLVLLSQLFVFNSYAADEDTYFVITAYYSPLPGQAKYTTGSYAGDIRLNGEGHTTASGKGVFPGLLAGPSNYPFGTKIYFEGYGIGAIEDRGGAIVEAGERGHSYDRIDIWMGYGDEGLARALTWGTRTIKGKIIVPSAEVTLNFGESTIGALTKLSVNPENNDRDDVIELQEIFTKADLYSGEIDGNYESIKSEIIDYQLSAGIISSSSDQSAGWYGPKTIAALREEYGNSTSTLVEEPIENYELFNHKQSSEKYKIILDYGNLVVTPESDSDTVRQLQELLIELGEYNGNVDGNYSSVENALISLQIRIGLVDDKDGWGAGYFGNQTKSALWTYYEDTEDNSSSVNTEITSTYTLSENEKDALEDAFEKIKSQKSKSYIDTLLRQIDQIIPVYQDNQTVLSKILYLQEIAN